MIRCVNVEHLKCSVQQHTGLYTIISEWHSVLAIISLCTLWIALAGDWSNQAGSRRKQRVYVGRYVRMCNIHHSPTHIPACSYSTHMRTPLAAQGDYQEHWCDLVQSFQGRQWESLYPRIQPIELEELWFPT